MCVKVVDSSLFARGTLGVKLGKEDKGKVLDLGLVNNIWGKKKTPSLHEVDRLRRFFVSGGRGPRRPEEKAID